MGANYTQDLMWGGRVGERREAHERINSRGTTVYLVAHDPERHPRESRKPRGHGTLAERSQVPSAS